MAEKNKAKLIEFNPTMSASDVNMPVSVSLVIANSLTPSPKILTLGTNYNKRVVECRFILALLALKTDKVKSPVDLPFKNLYDLQRSLEYSFD